MRRGYVIAFSLIWIFPAFGQSGDLSEFPPPFDFKVNTISLLATWQAPKVVLLDENFEGATFPPAGWSSSSLGEGWLGVESPDYNYWVVADHPGRFALTNDDAVYSNPGSLDYLVTPALDLTVADRFRLVFDSYFDAGYGEDALVKYCIDGGLTWDTLLNVPAYLYWKTLTIDLSEFSGDGGQPSFQLLFHADDRGYFASGWAIDDVRVISDDIVSQPIYYKMLIDSEEIAQVSDTLFQYYIENNTIRRCCALAIYEEGISDTVWQMVHSDYLAPPTNLVGNAPDDAVILYWLSPTIPSNPYGRVVNRSILKDASLNRRFNAVAFEQVIPYNLLGFDLYKKGEFLAFISGYEPIGSVNSYIDSIPEFDQSVLKYEITAVYDMTPFGFPGDTAESLPEGPAMIVPGCWWLEPDFYEDWSSGSFDENLWQALYSAWYVSPDIGNEPPSAVFFPDSVLSDPLENPDESFFRIYPNPSDGNFTLTTSEKIEMISLFTSSGRMILGEEMNEYQTELHLGDLEPGLYLLKVGFRETSSTYKLILLD